MEKIIGLDIGQKRIGVAVSDSLGLTAQGLITINRVGKKKDLDEIGQIIEQYDIKKVVVGLPLNMDGSMGESCEMVKKFAEKVKNKFNVEIIYVDERLSTVSATRVLLEANVSRENRKHVVDKVAASYILQSYLDRK
ncbi:MAG TPA: Holliday junction resolvase RuvX [Soehngenia sp.]|nr:Holliday junction resolvase RuvX [Soehngenia sp.]HPP32031.1 Holliday junction resolvase RuvX [Soehngenia sp.]